MLQTLTRFRMLDRAGRQLDVVTRDADGYASARVPGRKAKRASDIAAWYGRGARLAALV